MKHHAFHSPDACTACAVCVAHCPVAKHAMRFRGPKLTGPAHERFRLLGFGDDASLDYCSNCKNCDISCPSGVPVATFNMLARAARRRESPPAPRDWLLAHSGGLGKLAAPLPAWMLNCGMNNPVTRYALHALGIDRRAPLPPFGPLQKRRALAARRSADGARKTAVFFPGCFIRNHDPQTGLDVIRVLEKAGYGVIVPAGLECCGLPLVAGGYLDDAMDKARVNAMALARWTRRGTPVITACPSCALMLRHECRDLFPRDLFPDDNGLDGLAEHVIDACEFMTGLIGEGLLAFSGAKPRVARIAYHAPCHLRAQGAGRTGLELLRMVPGCNVMDMDAGCCGIAGSYGFKRGTYDIGMAVGEALFTAIRDSHAPLAASECGTCRVQIRHGSGIEAVHPVSMLLRAL